MFTTNPKLYQRLFISCHSTRFIVSRLIGLSSVIEHDLADQHFGSLDDNYSWLQTCFVLCCDFNLFFSFNLSCF